MEVFEAIRTILAVRQYQDKKVPDDVVRKVVEAGHLSASSMNLQPWHFVVVQEGDRLRELGRLAKTGPYIADAAFAVVVAIEKKSVFGVSDASRAIQNMMLAAWGDGVGSNWAGFVGGLEDVGKFVGVPAGFDVLAVIPFGYPATAVGRGKKNRKPLSEVASSERFGQSFAQKP
jgi:nitroreductase